MNRNGWWSIGFALVLLVPTGVGYATAPCDGLTGRPIALGPYRLAQQRFLTASAAALAELGEIAIELQTIAPAPPPASMAEAFRRAGVVTDLNGRLAQVQWPEPPVVYALLGEQLGQVRDTYTLAGEELLTYLGNGDTTRLTTAREWLTLAEATRVDLAAAVTGLQYPLCREVWRD